jgi:glycosyltransferase involved in cell wall biosynthesis
MPDLSILMPAYNERATIAPAIDRLLETELPVDSFELIVVDDGSSDGTGEILEQRDAPQMRLLRHDRNRGKGTAIRTALAEAGGTYTTILDADLEYDPTDLSTLLEPLLSGRADAVFGTRAFEAHSAYGFWYVLGNKTVTMAANILYNSWLSDIMNCWKAMPTDLLRSLDLREPGFGVEPEITARLLRSGTRIFEVPVTYQARSREEGKKLRAVDGIRVLRTLLRCRFD